MLTVVLSTGTRGFSTRARFVSAPSLEMTGGRSAPRLVLTVVLSTGTRGFSTRARFVSAPSLEMTGGRLTPRRQLRRGIVRVRLQLLDLADMAFVMSGGGEGPLISVGKAVGAFSEDVQRR